MHKQDDYCPKCMNRRIISVDNGKGMNIWNEWFTIRRFICCSCGYSEEWLEPAERLSELMDERSKVKAEENGKNGTDK